MVRKNYPLKKHNARDFKKRYLLRNILRTAGFIGIVLGLVVLDQLGVFSNPIQNDYEKYNSKTFAVVKVIDGDTLDIDIPDDVSHYPHTRIRLWGVDTPETVKPNTPVQHFGPQASAFTKRNCLNKTVRIELQKGNTRGKHGRLLAYIYLDNDKCLNSELVRLGLGFADPRYKHPQIDQFKKLQSQARKNKTGLWKDAKTTDLPYYMRSGK